METPFPHYGPLRPEQVHGRDELVSDLVERVTMRRVTALLGPRRYGKTSVLGKVASVVEAAGTSIVWVDLFESASMTDVAIRLDAALGGARGPISAALAGAASTVGFNLGVIRFELSRSPRPDTTATAHVLLDMLVESALAHPTLLVLDELSGIAGVKGAAGLLRTKLQHHFGDIGMLFAGSEPSTMRAMFSAAEQPLFGQADLVEVGPLNPSAIAEVVNAGFAATGRDPGLLALRIGAFTGGHPRRVMQLADAAWRVAEPGEPWDDAIWSAALEQVRAAASPASETLFANLGRAEQGVLRVLACGESIWGGGAERVGLGAGSARRALDKMKDAGHVTAERRLVDPFLQDWLARTLPI